MTLIEAAALGLVQGLTEFLPVSSSGHLVILQKLIGFEHPPIAFDVLVHMATLVAIAVVFWADLRRIDRQAAKAILIGSIPTAAIGLSLSLLETTLFNSLPLVATALLATSLLLLSTKYLKTNPRKTTVDIRSALIVGAAQGVAVIPGVSRSAATIVAGLWLGFDQKLAVRFAFLLAIPAILGAQLLKLRELATSQIPTPTLILGFLVASITGLLALRALKKIVESSKLHLFAAYTIALAALLFLF